MMGFGFVVPIPSADEYNDFVTQLPLSPALKKRLSTSSSLLFQNQNQNQNQNENENEHGHERDDKAGAAERSEHKTGVLKKWRMLVDGKMHAREGYESNAEMKLN
ncbi:hypothetical protein Trco_000619 [Trichoderma cornu-damae]|uniref:Uncharacterized protein n=1 Tax=Trichoderma cornu-damae TaxID=654480 RepID=A0A9P8U0H7_9HYPO|nr:hypothetical protein Trco_000619 [Trichoderma cornu-damae]